MDNVALDVMEAAPIAAVVQEATEPGPVWVVALRRPH